MDPKGIPHYLFEYDRPGKRVTGKTRYRMTLEEAKARHGDTYRPILDSVEYRKEWDGKPQDFEPYEPGTGPLHWGKKW